MIPTLCFARTTEELKKEVIFEFNLYVKENKEAFALSLAHTGVGRHFKGTIYIRDIDNNRKVYPPVAIDIWDGENIVWRTKGNMLNLK
jgi:hypothetical protein